MLKLVPCETPKVVLGCPMVFLLQPPSGSVQNSRPPCYPLQRTGEGYRHVADASRFEFAS